jgi:hypothetical protein
MKTIEACQLWIISKENLDRMVYEIPPYSEYIQEVIFQRMNR